MDWSMGKNVTYFDCSYVLTHFRQNPRERKEKKGTEIFSAALLAMALDCTQVGFPMREIKKSRYPLPGASLSDLIQDTSAVDDTDTDVVIEYKGAPARFQVVRLVAQANAGRAKAEFFRLVDKKLLVPVDETLYLLVNIEEAIRLPLDEVADYLRERRVPYGAIFAVGKAEQDSGRFQCVRLWPQYDQYEVIDTGLPM